MRKEIVAALRRCLLTACAGENFEVSRVLDSVVLETLACNLQKASFGRPSGLAVGDVEVDYMKAQHSQALLQTSLRSWAFGNKVAY
jgi:hypothetical protein